MKTNYRKLKTMLISIMMIFFVVSIAYIYSASFTINIYKKIEDVNSLAFFLESKYPLIILAAYLIFLFSIFKFFKVSTIKKRVVIFFLLTTCLIMGFVFKIFYSDFTSKFMAKQLLFYIIGSILFLIFSNIDYRTYKKYNIFVFLISIFLLVLVLIIGTSVKGAKRWIFILGFTIQPAELAKLMFVVCFSGILSKFHENNKKDFEIIVPAMLISFTYIGLILLERDLGSALHLMTVTLIMLFVSNVKIRYTSLLMGILSLMGGLFLKISPYRWKRVKEYIEGIWTTGYGGGYQTTQSLIGIGNGGFTGLGFGSGAQKYYYLPERHTDFIFAIICEENGFIGAFFLILSYVILMIVGTKIIKKSDDEYAKYIAFGITSLVIVQVLINLFVVTGLIPTTGLTLPFISYGGSSICTLMIAMGILVNVMTPKNNKDYIS